MSEPGEKREGEYSISEIENSQFSGNQGDDDDDDELNYNQQQQRIREALLADDQMSYSQSPQNCHRQQHNQLDRISQEDEDKQESQDQGESLQPYRKMQQDDNCEINDQQQDDDDDDDDDQDQQIQYNSQQHRVSITCPQNVQQQKRYLESNDSREGNDSEMKEQSDQSQKQQQTSSQNQQTPSQEQQSESDLQTGALIQRIQIDQSPLKKSLLSIRLSEYQLELKDHQKFHNQMMKKIEMDTELSAHFFKKMKQIGRAKIVSEEEKRIKQQQRQLNKYDDEQNELKVEFKSDFQSEQNKTSPEIMYPSYIFQNIPQMRPDYNYYEDFCKMSILNLAIKQNVSKVQNDNQKFKKRVFELEQKKRRDEQIKEKNRILSGHDSSINSVNQTVQEVHVHPHETPSSYPTITRGRGRGSSRPRGSRGMGRGRAIVNYNEQSNRSVTEDGDSDEEGGEYSYQYRENSKKRIRRVASEIQRHYSCPFYPCNKSYGSEGSLNQHLKLKHPTQITQSSGGKYKRGGGLGGRGRGGHKYIGELPHYSHDQ